MIFTFLFFFESLFRLFFWFKNGGYYDTPHWVLCALCSFWCKNACFVYKWCIVYTVYTQLERRGIFMKIEQSVSRKRLQITISEVTLNILDKKQLESGLSKSVLIDLAVQEYFKDEVRGLHGETIKESN